MGYALTSEKSFSPYLMTCRLNSCAGFILGDKKKKIGLLGHFNTKNDIQVTLANIFEELVETHEVDLREIVCEIAGSINIDRDLSDSVEESLKEWGIKNVSPDLKHFKRALLFDTARMRVYELSAVIPEHYDAVCSASYIYSGGYGEAITRTCILEDRKIPAKRINDPSGLRRTGVECVYSKGSADGGTLSTQDRELLIFLQERFEAYQAQIAKSLSGRKDGYLVRAAIAFFRMFTVDPCASKLAKKQAEEAARDLYTCARFFNKQLRFSEHMIGALFKLESAIQVFNPYALARKSKEYILPEFKDYILCLSDNLGVELRVLTDTYGYHQRAAHGRVIIPDYTEQNVLRTINLVVPSDDAGEAFHVFAVVYQLLILKMMRSIGLISREKDILDQLPRTYFDKGPETDLEHYLIDVIHFPLNEAKFDRFLFRFIVSVIEEDSGIELRFSEGEVQEIINNQQKELAGIKRRISLAQDAEKNADGGRVAKCKVEYPGHYSHNLIYHSMLRKKPLLSHVSYIKAEETVTRYDEYSSAGNNNAEDLEEVINSLTGLSEEGVTIERAASAIQILPLLA
jgi:hypothetical protein